MREHFFIGLQFYAAHSATAAGGRAMPAMHGPLRPPAQLPALPLLCSCSLLRVPCLCIDTLTAARLPARPTPYNACPH